MPLLPLLPTALSALLYQFPSFTLALAALLCLATTTVHAGSISVDNPGSIRTCESSTLSWEGDSPPFDVYVFEGTERSNPLQTFLGVDGNSVSWNTNVTEGTLVTVGVSDSADASGFSNEVEVGPSDGGSTCLNAAALPPTTSDSSVTDFSSTTVPSTETSASSDASFPPTTTTTSFSDSETTSPSSSSTDSTSFSSSEPSSLPSTSTSLSTSLPPTTTNASSSLTSAPSSSSFPPGGPVNGNPNQGSDSSSSSSHSSGGGLSSGAKGGIAVGVIFGAFAFAAGVLFFMVRRRRAATERARRAFIIPQDSPPMSQAYGAAPRVPSSTYSAGSFGNRAPQNWETFSDQASSYYEVQPEIERNSMVTTTTAPPVGATYVRDSAGRVTSGRLTPSLLSPSDEDISPEELFFHHPSSPSVRDRFRRV